MKKLICLSALVALVGSVSAADAKKPACTCEKCPCKSAYVVFEDTTGQREWKMPFQLGLAGYTMHKKSLDETLEIMQSLDLHFLCVKDFHLKYTATDAEIAAFKEKCAKYGVTGYGLGPLYTKDNAAVRAYFEFAKRFGTKVIVGVPYDPTDAKDSWGKRKGSRKQLEYIDTLVKEFDIKYAIHNHGPNSPEMFPDVEYGYNLIKDLDKRIGFCMDVGWEFGCDRDPAETIRTYGDRIYDIHLKNIKIDPVRNLAKEGPRGELDVPAILTALADIGYSGVCHVEYEKDHGDNLVQLAESFGYYRGVMDAIRVKPVMKPAPADANTLTDAERAEGWKLLWDGRTLDGWLAVKGGCKAPPEKGWVIADRTLTMRPVNGISDDGQWFPLPPEDARQGGGGDIVTAKKYRDFAFRFDFRLTGKANSGVKYFYDENLNKGTCEEFQILDDAHPDSEKGKDGNRRVAALYDVMPAAADDVKRRTGEWNTGMIVAKGSHVEHWLNGKKVLEYERGSKEFRDLVAASKYKTWGVTADGNPQPWGEIPEGRILLQDHSDSTVSFCNLKIREL